ncbi:CRISPR-associated ring nuclease Csm6 [uncultured Thiodictyon sp.]|uniref:CRISPR-associated ring nuclease Csm6 n=1 Tax=uncultured Thiodictyon sp. TaxID=1846217 RepID=UPI0025DBE8DF|nr:CRISPR-associated ring nuclease Csm6 [uncultured Thiodictyon sp.]
MSDNEKPMDQDAPQRRILLAVTGLSPQIVTETLFALAIQGEPRWVPTEVHLITTAEGADRARHSLLSADLAWFARLIADYRLPPIAFTESQIHVLEDVDGAPLGDIRTPADNDQAADQLTELVRRFTADPNTQVHASIAGGRKTMGYYLGYALSLFGRPGDRLSHVLVSEPFESTWDFFYPTPYSRIIETRDHKLADTAEARVMLAEIPFVSLRHGMPAGLLEGKSSFGEAVAAARAGLGAPELVIDYSERRILAGGRPVRLAPALLAFIGWLARRRQRGAPPVLCPLEDHPDPTCAAEYLAEYRAVIGAMGDEERTATRLAKGMDAAFFMEVKSRLHGKLRAALGLGRKPYQIDGSGKPRGYGVGVEGGQIRFVDVRLWF